MSLADRFSPIAHLTVDGHGCYENALAGSISALPIPFDPDGSASRCDRITRCEHGGFRKWINGAYRKERQKNAPPRGRRILFLSVQRRISRRDDTSCRRRSSPRS